MSLDPTAAASVIRGRLSRSSSATVQNAAASQMSHWLYLAECNVSHTGCHLDLLFSRSKRE